MQTKVTKAVLPIAGLGTRFLPATKSMPKEMMTLVDRPLIQYAMDEARDAGITDFIFVTARGKSSLVDYFDRAPELEKALEAKGKHALMDELETTNMPSGSVSAIRQQTALGLGHAVWCARRLIGNEPFAVILPDDVIMAETSCLKQMVDAHVETGGCMIAAMEVAKDAISAYGVLDTTEEKGRAVKVAGMVEKPDAADAPSNLAVIGRYILGPHVLDTLDNLDAGKGGEIQLTDAIAKEITDGRDVWGYKFDGRRFDCGNKSGYLQATVAYGLARDDLRDDFADFLKQIAADDPAL